MNTRRYPRTTLEAWPTRHPYCLERPAPRMSLMGDIALACAIGVGFGLLLAVWWSV
jgi:hypothetical protein